jgi:threonine dehydrogenase-like Zn-dependent dehydrogenase
VPARTRGFRPLITQIADVHDVVSAYEEFDRSRPGWLKVVLDPSA